MKVNAIRIIKIHTAELEIDIFCQPLSTAHKCIGKIY